MTLVEPVDVRISESQIETLREHYDRALQSENEEYVDQAKVWSVLSTEDTSNDARLERWS